MYLKCIVLQPSLLPLHSSTDMYICILICYIHLHDQPSLCIKPQRLACLPIKTGPGFG